MEKQALESYLGQMRDLISQKQENQLEDHSAIFHLIDEYTSGAEGNSSDLAFFEGERNFYQGNFENSLKFYLEAKEFPNFQFYCYRASSLISHARGQQDKALNYAQKAYKIDPKDPSLRNLYSDLPDAVKMESPQEIPQHALSGHGHHTDANMESNSRCVLEPEFLEMNENVRERGQSGYGSFFNTVDSHPKIQNNKTSGDTHKYTRGRFKENENSLIMASEAGGELEKRIQNFQNSQLEKMQAYLVKSEQKSHIAENLLCVLNGWAFKAAEKPMLFTEESRKSHGGHYLRWDGKGIAINPGPGFLDNFHSQGFSIKDIDFVIVTQNSREAYADLRAISELNQQLNKTSAERQVIHYYLHQRVYQQLAPFLKPSFKQARNTIHKLEMFLDSPDVERVELDEGIVLHYFLNAMPETTQNFRETNDDQALNNSNLGIRLELSNENKKMKIGYLSGLAWSPLLVHHLGYCDLLLAAFGNTTLNDYSRFGYNEDSLGYFGTASLLEELAPRLMLLTEFSGREGDIRLEVIKKMREECVQDSSPQKSILLPTDIGFTLDLNALQVKCLLSEDLVDPSIINVVASSDSFGRLRYLSSSFCA
ncbi:MAG: hypothetical protein H0W50_07590 [Parachlamydiaceae bacterium]|nr:hypothetical protein [Parachlamydiaceae bacterium]